MDRTITLNEAAEELGVHYMTAYRYVRLGLLPANKAGGVWRIRASDLARYRRSLDGAAVKGKPAAGSLSRRRRRADWAARYEARALAGDNSGAWRVVEAALASGTGIEDIYLEVIGPAMRAIGDGWARGEVDVAQEHIATAVTLKVMGRLAPRFVRRGRRRMSVVVGAAPGDPHSLPVSLLADLLAGAGFEVVDLGGNVPIESFVFAAQGATRLGAVGVSLSDDGCAASARQVISTLRSRFPRTPVLAGGPAVADLDGARQLGADHWAADGRATSELLLSLTR